MIIIRVTTTVGDCYELETDLAYNPTIVRDLRDVVMSMVPEAEAEEWDVDEFTDDEAAETADDE